MTNPTLHCDHCHHEVEVERIDKSLIGRICPICDDPMFTEGHWRSYQRVRMWKWASQMLRWVFFWQKPKTYKVKVTENSLEIRE